MNSLFLKDFSTRILVLVDGLPQSVIPVVAVAAVGDLLK